MNPPHISTRRKYLTPLRTAIWLKRHTDQVCHVLCFADGDPPSLLHRRIRISLC